MIKSRTQPSDENIALKRLVDLYPLAFALASASNFRSGLALRKQERIWLARPIEPPTQLDPVVVSVSSEPQQGYTL